MLRFSYVILCAFFLTTMHTALAQNNVGVGTNSPDISAALDVSSTDKGLLPPRLSTAQRNAMPNKTAGLLIYNTSVSCLEMYNGSAWINLCTGGPSSIVTKSLLGGNQEDRGYSVQQLADGGFIIGATTSSSANGDVTPGNHGGYDCWVIRLDASANILWNRVLGGVGDEQLAELRPTADGGFVFCASSTSSANGDVTEATKGLTDYWIVKLDASGNMVWNRLLGGDQDDIPTSINENAGGTIVVAGSSESSGTGNVTETNHGLTDFWIVKLNSTGSTITFNRLLGGNGEERAFSIKEVTSDNGYVVAGYSTSSANGNVSGVLNGLSDFWVLKLTSAGTLSWNRLVGGNAEEYAYSLVTVSDGSLIVGETNSTGGGNISGSSNGGSDYLIAKLSTTGTVSWTSIKGGTDDDIAWSVVQIGTDYVIAGQSLSSASGDVTEATHGATDSWLIKINSTGTLLWNKLLGGSGDDVSYDVRPTSDGGFVLTGYTNSSNNGNVFGVNHGGDDVWLYRLDGSGNIQ